MAEDGRRILTINSGSSSVKFSLFHMGRGRSRALKGAIERIGVRSGVFRAADGDGRTLVERHRDIADHDSAFDMLFSWLSGHAPGLSLDAAAHRIVHGGERLLTPRLVTEEVLAELVRLTPLAPDHLPAELRAIGAIRSAHPSLAQVVCFDTAFHRHMPELARIYPLPRFLNSEGVHRYGFHGLSYEYILAELERVAGRNEAQGRVLIAHLGNGASMAAVRGGKGIETTMGLTPAGGLVMGTRSGDLDPGVILYLLEEKGLRPSTVADMVNRHAGLQAVSGITSDMKELLRLEATDSHAAEAIALFCYQAKKFVGSCAAVLGGLDTLVFTGGIGENAPEVRERICEGLAFLGISLDGSLNAANGGVISDGSGSVTVRVIKTDEELMIARHAVSLLDGKG